MARSYPLMPDRKMAWDNDGTVVYGSTDGDGDAFTSRGEIPVAQPAFVEWSLSLKEDINDNLGGSTFGTSGVVQEINVIILMFFPEARDIDGYYWNGIWGSGATFDTKFISSSDDTTTGWDGTWSAIGSEIASTTKQISPDHRDNIQPSSTVAANAVMLQQGVDPGVFVIPLNTEAIHLYGRLSAGETPDRLLYLDYDNSDIEFVRPLDFENMGRGDSLIRRFTVKNNSSTLQANTVQVTAEHLVEGSAMVTYSTDGIADQATKSLGNIAADGTATAYLHLVIPDAQRLDLYEMRSSLTVASWT